uniref:HECT domain-containing protein n=1 Tax=Oreochromis niloticus TaxID=8128 RepID=I3KX51_ORENI
MIYYTSTPKGSEEFVHLQAGLLKDLYPKLESVSGGWLIYKAAGGWGSRKLNMVPPEDSGYTGSVLKNASAGGKTVLYIAPLQEELDTQPLPPDSSSFSNMPKAMCQSCQTSYPLQLLALHFETCQPSDTNAQEVCTIVCPVCGETFPQNEVEAHASECCESLDEILQAISTAVNTEEEFRITVSRSNMVERGLAQWKRQKKALPTNQLRVTFIGEAGIDTGALRKEFLTDMVAGLEQRLFEGDQTGKAPKYSLLDLDLGNFRSAGEIWAVSLAQGGPPPCCLKDWCYQFLCNGELQIENIMKEDVCDAHYTSVHSATEDEMTALTDEILSCGYHGPVNVEKKEEILRAVVLHATLRLVPLLSQLRDGLNLYGLTNLLKQYPNICRSLFVPGVEVKRKHKASGKQYLIFNLNDCFVFFEKGEEPEAGDHPVILSPSSFLQWLTGQGYIPVLPDEKINFKVSMQFDHSCHIQYGAHEVCYPTVTANTVKLPVQHMQTYEEFKYVMTNAFHHGQAFLHI